MRLADQLVERANQPLNPIDRYLTEWGAKLRAADCFEVDPSAGELAHATLSTTPAASLVRTRDSAALPAQITWFEWRGPSAGMGPHADEPPRPGTIEPDRCGVLIETDESLRRGVASWVWRLPGLLHLEPCPLSVCFDWRSEPAEVPDIIRASFALHGTDWAQALHKVHEESRFAAQDFGPFISEERRYGLIPCPWMPEAWRALDILAAYDLAKALQIIRDVLQDLEHEPVFLAGLVICLSTPGLLDVSDPADMTRLNAARRKRRRPELLSFRKITASGQNIIRLSDRGGALETMRGFHAA